MNVRDPGYDPRRTHPRSGAHPAGGRPSRGAAGGPGGSGSRTPIIVGAVAVIALVAVVGLGFGGGFIGGPSGGSATPGASAAGGGTASAAPGESPLAQLPVESAPPDDGAAAPPEESPEASPEVVLVETDVAIVPVTDFRSPRSTTRPADVAGIADGSSPYRALVLVEEDADAILAAIGTDREALGDRLVTVADADAVAARLAAKDDRLAFLRADDVRASVRALAWSGKSLFGVDRVKRLENWPLTARLLGPETPAYDPAGAWTLFSGGDILLDRGVKQAIDANGADFPFEGGTVKITGWCRDCSPMGWDLPRTRQTGNDGIVQDLISGADIAIANFENPAPNVWRWHGSGTVFNADPDLIDALVDAGIDWVSLANNHIGDAGRTGMLQTMKNLDKRGMAHGGLGKNLEKAHEPSLLQAGDVTVAILAYDQIAGVYNAGEDLAGSARMSKKALKRDVRAARAAGADVVIVFPHWGIEYRATPSLAQQTLGRAAINAGADLVIGNHPHWVEGMEVYKGKPIWYALGNFVFDQTWSDYTMEGITLELTFNGAQLVQAAIRPHLVMGKAQPNFMDPADQGGAFVMNQLWDASEGLLPW